MIFLATGGGAKAHAARSGRLCAQRSNHCGAGGFRARGQILFVTFRLIVVTLLGQGRCYRAGRVGLGRHSTPWPSGERNAKLAVRFHALEKAQSRLQELSAHAAIAPEVIAILRARQDYRLDRLPRGLTKGAEASSAVADITMELIAAKRDYIYRMLQKGRITDEARRRLDRELDLKEASIALNREEGVALPT